MAGLVGGMKIAKLLAIIIIPVAFAAIVTASVFAYLFFRNKRRFASQAVRRQQSLLESHFHRCATLNAIGFLDNIRSIRMFSLAQGWVQ